MHGSAGSAATAFGCRRLLGLALRVLGSVLLLGERPTPTDWLGLVLVIAASSTIMIPRRMKAKAAERPING